jgi:S-adenosylmethionine:tRNA ribosyltransferase-isomerase
MGNTRWDWVFGEKGRQRREKLSFIRVPQPFRGLKGAFFFQKRSELWHTLQCMSLSLKDYDFVLNEAQIAQFPVEPRDSCRLMVLDKTNRSSRHAVFHDIGQYLRPNDLLILNNSKVLKARLFAYDSQDRKFEVLLLSPKQNLTHWQCMIRPAKKLEKGGYSLRLPGGYQAKAVRESDFLFSIHIQGIDESEVLSWIEAHGELPLPPYIRRPANEADAGRYQTVFAEVAGSVAAPTAGLHFTTSLLDSLRLQAIEIDSLTLHVGYGTFSPIRSDDLTTHQMHCELYDVPAQVWEKIQRTKQAGGRVIACGTTVVRALESIKTYGLRSGTELFIQPGFEFSVVDGLITNFHLPKSSLLVLVSAFASRDFILEKYAEAQGLNYRFFSYGDAMLIL